MDDRKIGPDVDSPLQEQTRKSPASVKNKFVAQSDSGRPTVKPKAKRTRKREKNIMAMDRGELEVLTPNWLDLPQIEAEFKIEDTMKRTVVQAHTKFASMPPCTHCGPNTHVTKADIREKARNIKDSKRDGKFLLIVLIVQRYSCGSCGKTFTPRLAALAGGKFSLTQRLSSETEDFTFLRLTNSGIAVLTGLSRRKVQDLAREAAKSLPTPQEVFLEATTK